MWKQTTVINWCNPLVSRFFAWPVADIYLRFHGPVHGRRLGCRAPVGVGRLGARRHRRLLRFGLGRLRGTLDVLPVSLVGLLREQKRTRGSEVSAGPGKWGSSALEGFERRRRAISRRCVTVSSPAGRAETLRELEAGTFSESRPWNNSTETIYSI